MISVFDLFKIGIGPSSSHTVGPMRAARQFVSELETDGQLGSVCSITVDLFGSLALTGKGHGTDRALVLGLLGEVPDQVDPATLEPKLAAIREQKRLLLLHVHEVPFDWDQNLVFHPTESLPAHPNGMRFTAQDSQQRELYTRVFYSIGGGFIVAEGEGTQSAPCTAAAVPYDFKNGADLLSMGNESQKSVWMMVFENEKIWRTEDEIRSSIQRIWQAMQDCVTRGLRTDGILPGGLNVRRRAPRIFQELSQGDNLDPLSVVDWINLFAIAVNEENAAGGRVVTAPTNGAAGVIPAVAQYYQKFVSGADEEGILRFFLTAGAIGILYKENASISGAEVGCQGEVGVACSMAAGGLVAALNGTNEQIEHASEIAMEHNLGMTCDPIGGLVQIPCIERNAFGAAKAVNAARMAIKQTGDHKVSLDQVIRTMYETGRDMQARYKETSLGGLAVNVVEC